MRTFDLLRPLNIEIKPLLKNFSKNKDNEQIWILGDSHTIEATKLILHRDYAEIETSDLKSYSVLPKNSRKNITGDLLESDCRMKNMVEKFMDGSINLRWKTESGTKRTSGLTTVKDMSSVIASLNDNIYINQEELHEDGTIKKPGFRPPQVGAIYAILSNIAVSREPITVVLPTGTGKSETILGTIVANKVHRSLIIVPSDGLRSQFYNNSLNWGILKKIGVVQPSALNPIVSKLGSSIKSEEEIIDFVKSSNIIVATASILNKLTPTLISFFNKNIDIVFIDEAHHSSAPTWESLKEKLQNPKIIQFTATPFREDGKTITGKIVFNYALEDAQKNNFFTKIDFVPVVDYDPDNWDKTISEKSIEILRKDIEDGKDHILMARVDNISKAKTIFEKYYKQYQELNPILITSKSTSSNTLIEKLRNGESKIVVCVNMLGEGIDIPQLKIAALHDIRKSLTVTLQFIGRFTRSNKSHDPAKIIANIADVKIEKKLRQLYKEDADWGKLIAFSSAKEIQKKIKFQEVLTNFKNSKIPLFNIKPKLSAVVYKTKDNKWLPEKIEKYLEKTEELFLLDINEKDGLAIAIFQTNQNIDWLDSKIFTESSWELLLIYFDRENNLLYVNSSQKSVDESLVNSIVKVDYKFEKEAPFKCYHGLGYVVLFTLGLDKNTDSPIKYAMYAGTDVYDGISDMEKNKSSKSNTYGLGFKDGEELTLGASKHGKIWSRLIGNIQEWKEWCDEIGRKLSDTTIDVDKIFKGFLQPRHFGESDFTKLNDPTSIDYPTAFYQENESVQSLIFDGIGFDITELSLFVNKNGNGYSIEFKYNSGSFNLDLIYIGDTFDFVPKDFKKVEYKKKNTQIDFINYIKSEDSFRIRLLDGTFIENNYHFKPYNPGSIFPLDENLITTIDWTGVDLSSESRGIFEPYVLNSIQDKIFSIKNSTGKFNVIFNDDDPGEVADLLCFGETDDRLLIEVIHCKYKLRTDNIGSRVKDFYELCCQAQKTVKSIPDVLRLFDHIKAREVKTQKRKGSRFLTGDLKTLELLIKSNSYKRPKIKIILVQPGLSKKNVSKEVLELLGSTNTLLKETLNADFEVICS